MIKVLILFIACSAFWSCQTNDVIKSVLEMPVQKTDFIKAGDPDPYDDARIATPCSAAISMVTFTDLSVSALFPIGFAGNGWGAAYEVVVWNVSSRCTFHVRITWKIYNGAVIPPTGACAEFDILPGENVPVHVKIPLPVGCVKSDMCILELDVKN